MAFAQDKITKQHILDAIAEIDRDGVRKGRQSDVVQFCRTVFLLSKSKNFFITGLKFNFIPNK